MKINFQKYVSFLTSACLALMVCLIALQSPAFSLNKNSGASQPADDSTETDDEYEELFDDEYYDEDEELDDDEYEYYYEDEDSSVVEDSLDSSYEYEYLDDEELEDYEDGEYIEEYWDEKEGVWKVYTGDDFDAYLRELEAKKYDDEEEDYYPEIEIPEIIIHGDDYYLEDSPEMESYYDEVEIEEEEPTGAEDYIVDEDELESERYSVEDYYGGGKELAKYLEDEFGEGTMDAFDPDNKDYLATGEPIVEIFTIIDPEYGDTTEMLFAAKRRFRSGSDDFRHVKIKNLYEDYVYQNIPEYFSGDEYRIVSYITPDSISFYLEAVTEQPHHQVTDIWDLDNKDLHYHFPGMKYRFSPLGLQVDIGDTLDWTDFVYGNDRWKERWIVLGHDQMISGSQYYPLMQRTNKEPEGGFSYFRFFSVDDAGVIKDTLEVDAPFRQLIKKGLNEFVYFSSGTRREGYKDISVYDFRTGEKLKAPEEMEGDIAFVVENNELYMEVRNRIPLKIQEKAYSGYVNHRFRLYDLSTGDLATDTFYSRPLEYRFVDYGRRVEIYNPQLGWQ
ncbi:hypothetical protein ACFLQJ_00445 [Calditrichota bacterium]